MSFSSGSIKVADGKREDFRRYLEEQGVLEVFTRVLTRLFDEQVKPDEPLRYVAAQLEAPQENKANIDSLRNQLSDAQSEAKRLRADNESLKAELTKARQLQRLAHDGKLSSSAPREL